MSEIIVKMDIVKIDDRHIKIKGGEYFRDLVRCKDCKYWVYNFNGCSRNPCTEPWLAEDFCSYGEVSNE